MFDNDTVVFVIDFAENYSFEIQNEVQSMHWHLYQITWHRHSFSTDAHDGFEFSMSMMIRLMIISLFSIAREYIYVSGEWRAESRERCLESRRVSF